jgi:hypothetical protein
MVDNWQGDGAAGLSKWKTAITLRLDEDVVEAYRETGDGWQTRINTDLRRARKLPRWRRAASLRRPSGAGASNEQNHRVFWPLAFQNMGFFRTSINIDGWPAPSIRHDVTRCAQLRYVRVKPSVKTMAEQLA